MAYCTHECTGTAHTKPRAISLRSLQLSRLMFDPSVLLLRVPSLSSLHYASRKSLDYILVTPVIAHIVKMLIEIVYATLNIILQRLCESLWRFFIFQLQLNANYWLSCGRLECSFNQNDETTTFGS
jgi:hypothetical protein